MLDLNNVYYWSRVRTVSSTSGWSNAFLSQIVYCPQRVGVTLENHNLTPKLTLALTSKMLGY